MFSPEIDFCSWFGADDIVDVAAIASGAGDSVVVLCWRRNEAVLVAAPVACLAAPWERDLIPKLLWREDMTEEMSWVVVVSYKSCSDGVLKRSGDTTIRVIRLLWVVHEVNITLTERVVFQTK